jgi:hypothetical protein
MTEGAEVPQDHEGSRRAREEEGSLRLNALAGVSLGTIVGLLIGLSSVPAVASALGALLAMLLTFFGFARKDGAMATKTSGARFAAFGLAMAAAVVAGIALRAHGALGPSFYDRVDRFAVEGMPRERALELATYEHLGLRIGQLAKVEGPVEAPRTSPFAFAGTGDPACAILDADRYADVKNRLEAMQSRDGPWAAVASPDISRIWC